MRNNTASNPFAQRPSYWTVSFHLPAAAVGTAEEAFNDIAQTVGYFEVDEANHQWIFELVFEEKPPIDDIERRLMLISSLHAIDTPEYSLEQLQQQDWLAQVAQLFPPLHIERFYVHGAHAKGERPLSTIPIEVDAGAAFGSGEHGTTRCCLQAMGWLARRRRFHRVLDMGTGSGILAIAAAKLWSGPSMAKVVAVDIDPVSVKVTRENARKNGLPSQLACTVSDGYAHPLVRQGAQYDLIIANILARPLVSFAPRLAASLTQDGVAVLSGLLVWQARYVLAAHRAQGLHLKKQFTYQDWCTLVIGR
jgi:ribosomal protein L11 methyltransferase